MVSEKPCTSTLWLLWFSIWWWQKWYGHMYYCASISHPDFFPNRRLLELWTTKSCWLQCVHVKECVQMCICILLDCLAHVPPHQAPLCLYRGSFFAFSTGPGQHLHLEAVEKSLRPRKYQTQVKPAKEQPVIRPGAKFWSVVRQRSPSCPLWDVARKLCFPSMIRSGSVCSGQSWGVDHEGDQDGHNLYELLAYCLGS